MSKNVLLLGLLIALTGCQAKKEQTPVTPTDHPEQTVPDMHTAQNALDYQGTYQGTLPTASGIGMEVTLVLDDSTYRKTVHYLDKDGDFVTDGRYSWDRNGTVITLHGDQAPNQYFVGENQLFHLDSAGNRVTGDQAALYILRKQ